MTISIVVNPLKISSSIQAPGLTLENFTSCPCSVVTCSIHFLHYTVLTINTVCPFFEVGPDTNVHQFYLVQCYSLSPSDICHGEPVPK